MVSELRSIDPSGRSDPSGASTSARPSGSSGNGSKSGNGSDAASRLAVGGRRRRLGLAAVGGLFILLAGLIGASLFASLRSSTPVLVLRTDIDAGDVLTADQLIVVELGTDGLGQLAYLPADRQDTIVGLTALGPVPSGTLVSPAMFGTRTEVIPAGHAVVGVVLDRGALPAGVIQAGDEVELIAAADITPLTEGAVADVIGRARVWVVEPATELERGTSVSLVVASDLVPAVAQAAADERLRVGLVGQ